MIRYCVKCGRKNRPDSKKCAYCGHTFAESVIATSDPLTKIKREQGRAVIEALEKMEINDDQFYRANQTRQREIEGWTFEDLTKKP